MTRRPGRRRRGWQPSVDPGEPTAVRYPTRGRRRRPSGIRHETGARRSPLAFAFALGALLAGGAVFMATRPSSTRVAGERAPRRAALRDKAQIKILTELARTTRDRLVPCSRASNAPFPTSPPPPRRPRPTSRTLARKSGRRGRRGLGRPALPAETAARGCWRGEAFLPAIRRFATAVDTYAAAQKLTGSTQRPWSTLLYGNAPTRSSPGRSGHRSRRRERRRGLWAPARVPADIGRRWRHHPQPRTRRRSRQPPPSVSAAPAPGSPNRKRSPGEAAPAGTDALRWPRRAPGSPGD